MMTILLSLTLSLALPSFAAPPDPALDFTLTPKTLEDACAKAVAAAQERLDQVAAISPERRNFDNTPRALDMALAELGDRAAAPTFLKEVSTDPAVREAGHACEVKVEKFLLDVFAREDLYRALRAYAGKGQLLEGEDAKLLEKTLLDFRRNGLDLPLAERERLLLLRRQLVDLELDYGKNLNDVKDYLPLSEAETAGLPADFLARLERLPDGRRKVTLDYPDYYPFMENASDAAARKRLDALFKSRAWPRNSALIEEALLLRRRAARMLGYPTHAHYVLAERMAKDPERVRRFLDGVRRKLKRLARGEKAALLSLKGADEPGARELYAHDYLYYHNRMKKARYDVDDEKVKEYFPAEKTVDGMLAVYQRLFGLRFEQIPAAKDGADRWHPDVRLFKVFDAGTGEPLAHFYLDLFPREGKYKHAAAFTLIGGRAEPGGAYRRPVSAMVANFNKPTKDAPSLLKHSEVRTLFHEFGHIVHQTLTRARHPRFAGSRTARDFVEAPSQMLENWVWQKDVLRAVSGHYKDGRPLPEDLLARMVAAKNLDAGLRYLRQLSFATIDQAYHGRDAVDPGRVYRSVWNRVSLAPDAQETHQDASFGHLMGGYDAAYYGYLWSEVYAADMFSLFEKEGVMDPELGRRYRTLILEPGGGKDEARQLAEFLGRAPDERAFLRSIGLR